MLEDILAVIVRRNAQDPENHVWHGDAYFLMEGHWQAATASPDWAVLGRPEVMRALVRVAGVLADVPDGLPKELRAAVESMRKRAAGTLREADAKGLLPAEGKALLGRLPPPEKK